LLEELLKHKIISTSILVAHRRLNYKNFHLKQEQCFALTHQLGAHRLYIVGFSLVAKFDFSRSDICQYPLRRYSLGRLSQLHY
jgi:hypothetical protein